MLNDKPFVWILDDEFQDHNIEFDRYEKAGYEYKVTRSHELEEDLKKYAKIADGVVAQIGFPCGKNIIDKFESCKVIAISGVGYNHVDLKAATQKGIYVSNVPDYCVDEVTDHTLSMILYWARRLAYFHDSVTKEKKWDPLFISDIRNLRTSTIGLLGFGRMAKTVASKLKVFGSRIIAHDNYVDKKDFDELGVESVSLDELLRESHFLSLHVPLTKETENLLNKENLMKLPKNSFIVNTCRGGIINESDLVELLNNGHIGGVALDVLEQEPPDFDNPLLYLDNALITPHSAYNSIEALPALKNITCDIIIEGIETGRLKKSLNGHEI